MNIIKHVDSGISFITFINKNSLSVELLSFGAGIGKIALLDSNKDTSQVLNLCCPIGSDLRSFTFDTYAGMTLAPSAGRLLADGGISIYHNQPLKLSPNDRTNNLHGGYDNLSHINWNIGEIYESSDSASVSFSSSLADSVDGWPGNRYFKVTYTLDDSNHLCINYQAETDMPTYINMSNHTYWNLNSDGDALLERLIIPADKVCINNDNHLPICTRSVDHSGFDFRQPRVIADALSSMSDETDEHQKNISKGLNHGYLLSSPLLPIHKDISPLRKASELLSSDGSLHLTMFTDAPGVVVYSGGFLPKPYIALEAQTLPTIMPYIVTTPDRPFSRNILFQLDI